MMFVGDCIGCGEYSDQSRGAVEVAIDTLHEDDDVIGEYLCLSCASDLVSLLKKAIKRTNRKIEAGYNYRSDKWKKKEQP
jgi:hypothetical protein